MKKNMSIVAAVMLAGATGFAIPSYFSGVSSAHTEVANESLTAQPEPGGQQPPQQGGRGQRGGQGQGGQQGPGPDGGPGRGPGGPGGPGRGIPREIARGINELGLEGEAKTKVDAAVKSYQDEMKKLREKLMADLKAALTPEQYAQLEEAASQPPPPPPGMDGQQGPNRQGGPGGQGQPGQRGPRGPRGPGGPGGQGGQGGPGGQGGQGGPPTPPPGGGNAPN